MTHYITLSSRAVLRLTGEDRSSFLQGLISNDINYLKKDQALWAALLTPQGKWRADFFLYHTPQAILLECASSQRDLIMATLNRYKLRAKIQIESTHNVVSAAFSATDTLINDNPSSRIASAQDPRSSQAGLRIISTEPLKKAHHNEDLYHLHRLKLGLPDTIDCLATQPFLLEANFDIFNGIAWEKGCYMGQEVTARTHYRGLVKKRLIRVTADASLPSPSTSITSEGQEVGLLTSAVENWGMAMLRLDSLQKPLQCGDLYINPLALPEQIPTKEF